MMTDRSTIVDAVRRYETRTLINLVITINFIKNIKKIYWGMEIE